MYEHGVRYSEIETGLVPMVTVGSPTVAIGLAPKGAVNKPILCHSMTEFTKEFGWSTSFEDCTLCEVAKVHFSLYNVAPVIFINILDTEKHVKEVTKTLTVKYSRAVKLRDGGLIETFTAKSNDKALTKGTDYVLTYGIDGLEFTIKDLSKVKDGKVTATYKAVDGSKVQMSDVVGTSVEGVATGLECLKDVYPTLGLIPGAVIIPRYSRKHEVAAAMAAKCRQVSGLFQTIGIVDMDTETVKSYTACLAAKDNASLVDSHLVICYPKVKLSNIQYYLSTHIAALMSRVDSENEDIPYISPSNKELKIDGACLADGTGQYLTIEEANYLNGEGIVTAINFNGWRAWGNRTGIYPESSDPKDSFIPCRRMVNWVGNTLCTTFASKVDSPLNRRLVESVEDSVNRWLNGLMARGVILGGRVECLSEENPQTELIDGLIKFHCFIGFAVPARDIEFYIEFDPSYYETIFS